MKYGVGDRVEVVKASWVKLGATGTVKDMDDNGCLITMDDKSQNDLHFKQIYQSFKYIKKLES